MGQLLPRVEGYTINTLTLGQGAYSVRKKCLLVFSSLCFPINLNHKISLYPSPMYLNYCKQIKKRKFPRINQRSVSLESKH